MTRHEITWRSEALSSHEQCVISDVGGPSSITGTAELPLNGTAAVVRYNITTDEHWKATAASVHISSATGSRAIDLRRNDGRWRVDGTKRPDLDECTTVDFGWSPATNTLALRAAPLAIGESAESVAAWLRFPELDVVASRQTYTRLAADRVRYDSATFTAELAVTKHDIVVTYGDGLWQQI